MSRYARVKQKVWNSPKFRRLHGDAKLLWLYLLTSPHGNMIGLYVLKPGYAQADLGWTGILGGRRYNKALGLLVEAGLILHDADTHMVLIYNYLEHNPLDNPNQLKSAAKRFDEFPDCPLLEKFYRIVEAKGEIVYERMLEPLRNRFERV